MRRTFTRFALLIAGLSTGPGCAARTTAQDPARTDPDVYQVVFENDRVRVLRYHDVPGKETHQHAHPDMVMVPLSSFRRQLTFADGKTKELDVAVGRPIWNPAQTHVGKNVGATETDVVLVELK